MFTLPCETVDLHWFQILTIAIPMAINAILILQMLNSSMDEVIPLWFAFPEVLLKVTQTCFC